MDRPGVEVDATHAVGHRRQPSHRAKWYELGNLATTPTITQFGTLCTTAPGSGIINAERGALPDGRPDRSHAALAQLLPRRIRGHAAAGRLRTDPPADPGAGDDRPTGWLGHTNSDGSRNRWGDYSFTSVDPTDDQTLTIQEFATNRAIVGRFRRHKQRRPAAHDRGLRNSVVCNGAAAVT